MRSMAKKKPKAKAKKKRKRGKSLPADLKLAHQMLDRAGTPKGETVSERIYKSALRWLDLAQANGHSQGCQDKLCSASRKMVSSYE